MPLDRIQNTETLKNGVLMSFNKVAAFLQQMKSTAGYIKVNSPPDFTTNYKTHPPLVHL